MPDTSIYNKALQFLARRDYSEKELLQKLRLHFPESEPLQIQSVLEKLKAQKYLDNQRFMAGRIRHRLEQGYGPNKIIAELAITHGFDKNAVIAELQVEKNQDESQVLKHLIQKRFAKVNFSDRQAKNKVIQYCLRRGFELEQIKAIIARDD